MTSALEVQLIAHTQSLVGQTPYDAIESSNSGGADLAAFAGRNCYQSWDKPNPKTASVQDYIGNIIDHRHFSVLEHASATFHVSGVSRALTHELVRHRIGFSYSQLSQRYCPMTEGYVEPPLYQGDEDWQQIARDMLSVMWENAAKTYVDLVEMAQQQGIPRKKAREAARAVLPNMTGTQIVVTANHRAWRDFIQKRATAHADAEIREFAVELFRQLSALEPALYADGAVTHPDSGVETVMWS